MGMGMGLEFGVLGVALGVVEGVWEEEERAGKWEEVRFVHGTSRVPHTRRDFSAVKNHAFRNKYW